MKNLKNILTLLLTTSLSFNVFANVCQKGPEEALAYRDHINWKESYLPVNEWSIPVYQSDRIGYAVAEFLVKSNQKITDVKMNLDARYDVASISPSKEGVFKTFCTQRNDIRYANSIHSRALSKTTNSLFTIELDNKFTDLLQLLKSQKPELSPLTNVQIHLSGDSLMAKEPMFRSDVPVDGAFMVDRKEQLRKRFKEQVLKQIVNSQSGKLVLDFKNHDDFVCDLFTGSASIEVQFELDFDSKQPSVHYVNASPEDVKLLYRHLKNEPELQINKSKSSEVDIHKYYFIAGTIWKNLGLNRAIEKLLKENNGYQVTKEFFDSNGLIEHTDKELECITQNFAEYRQRSTRGAAYVGFTSSELWSVIP